MWWKSAVNLSFLLCLAACRMRSSACDTLARSCARRVLCWSAFPSVPALCSTNSAADRSALFAGFTAPFAESDFPPPCIIGFGSSPSRCGPVRNLAAGKTQDLPTSGAFLLRVTCSSTPAGWQCLAYRPCSCCVRLYPRSPLLRHAHFVAQSQTPRNCCVRFVAAVTVGSRNTHYRAARYGLTRAGLSPAGLHQLLLAPSERGAEFKTFECDGLTCGCQRWL